MKKVIIITLLLSGFGVRAQTRSGETITGYQLSNSSFSYIREKPDTIQVLAYCVKDWNTAQFEWRHLYALVGFDDMSVNFNGLIIYKRYLTVDKKPVKFKVIYAITK